MIDWTLVTESNEFKQCCVVIGDVRCGQRTAWRVSSKDQVLDDYAMVCGDHVSLVSMPGDAVHRVLDAAELNVLLLSGIDVESEISSMLSSGNVS